MALKTFLPQNFAHEHENKMFHELHLRLSQECQNRSIEAILLGNILVSNNELDAVFIKRDAICVVEMKNYGGMIHFSENGPWYADEAEIRGGNQRNPFIQARKGKFDIIGYINQHSSRVFGDHQNTCKHVSAMVLFGQDIHFDERLPDAILPWFHISDMRVVAAKLLGLGSQQNNLDQKFREQFLEQLGVGTGHEYHDGVVENGIPREPVPSQCQIPEIIYLRESSFLTSLESLKKMGGARLQAAINIRHTLENIRKGQDSITEKKYRTLDIIRSSQTYRFGQDVELLAIASESKIYPLFTGVSGDVNSWAESHKGLVVTVDQKGGLKISYENMNPDDVAIMPVTSAQASGNLFSPITEELKLEMVLVQPAIRRMLEAFDVHTPENEIMEALDLIPSNEIKSYLTDIINSLRKGDIEAAKSRIKLRSGEACPANDSDLFTESVIDSGESSDSTVVINDLPAEDFEKLMEPDKFAEWMLYLHPDQKNIVETDYNRPVVLNGVSGSGKTCVIVHRARYLAKKYPGERIGIITLNRSLSRLIQNLVNDLCGQQEASQIHVYAYYDYLKILLNEFGAEQYFNILLEKYVEPGTHMEEIIKRINKTNFAREYDPLAGETLDDAWDDFIWQEHIKEWEEEPRKFIENLQVDFWRYLREEFSLIRSAFPLTTRQEDYLKYEREGRSIRLEKDLRKDILRLLLFYQEYLFAGELLDDMELTHVVLPHRSKIKDLPLDKRFHSLLIDEYQDFSSLDIGLLRDVPTGQENRFMLAGDPAQKIHVKSLRLGVMGFDVTQARWYKIRKNYRNSKNILRAAYSLIEKYAADAKSEGEEIEILSPELAVRETCNPIVIECNNEITRAWEIVKECLEANGANPWSICIADCRQSESQIKTIIQQCPTEIKVARLGGDYMRAKDTVVVGSIADLKGFEFSMVVITGCSERDFPPVGTAKGELWRHAFRLYVAMTRARDMVYFLHERPYSEFIKIMENHIQFCEEQ